MDRPVFAPALLALLALSPACAAPAPPPTAVPAGDEPLGMTALQKKKAEMLTSLWENGTTVLKYAYCENIGDGRGYTSGRAGFCTGTGDALEVLRCFDASFGTGGANKLHKYVPALAAIGDKLVATGHPQADTRAIDAIGPYAADWISSANDPSTAAAFDACQDRITSRLYFEPGLEVAKRWGLTTALAKAALYDAEINHGTDGVEALAKKANADTGNASQTPARAPLPIAAQSAWLQSFLAHRAATLGADKDLGRGRRSRRGLRGDTAHPELGARRGHRHGREGARSLPERWVQGQRVPHLYDRPRRHRARRPGVHEVSPSPRLSWLSRSALS